MKKIRILFICVHNTARSQMAEAMANRYHGDIIIAESAGFEPGRPLNELAVEAMTEIGIDISGSKSKGVFELFKKGGMYGYVITVCDESTAERCPVFPGVTKRLHWSLEDPASFTGSFEARMEQTRSIRESIRKRLELLTEEIRRQ
ncbi:MAG: arsenate reductase ArsC [Spirochaetes bacterium]|jgi:arsenate reductase|nr:arsenate reductase ArsC [Spirochaetota bacterium]